MSLLLRTVVLQLRAGQYCWSMMMGLSTLSTRTYSTLRCETVPGWEGAHVLTLTPFVVPTKVQFLMSTNDTSSPAPLPRLPMLIPWPGPQWTPLIFMLFDPELKDMQSSPVAITESKISMWCDVPMWIPSVLGLSPGADMVMFWIVMSWLAKRLMWTFLLLIDVMSWIFEFVTKSNLKVWHKKMKWKQKH